MLLSALAFSLMVVGVKQVGDRIPLGEVVLARGLVSLALSLWMVRRLGVNPWGRRRGLLALRGLVGSAALFCVYAAVVHLPLAAATVLQYLYPTFTALLAWMLLGEPLGRRVLMAMGLGWLGVLLVARPAATAPLPPVWVLVAVAGAVLTALAYVSVRRLAESEHPAVIVLYFPLVTVPMSLPLVLLDPVLPTPMELLALVGVGVLTQVGQVGLTRALSALPAARATAISYVQVGLAGFWGWWIFGETIDLSTAAGALLILMATLISLSDRAGVSKRPEAPPETPVQ
ncbi:DMT family transporter [Synechococcus sp. CCY 9618]|uniref:DMT family transporter n=1 Tax=Synechococcus sp. CCY 9618 TaxID=2815602 RepID=UPI001C23B2AD|nr:DMT family transporter [Synechococcus sp. CCY 9618]